MAGKNGRIAVGNNGTSTKGRRARFEERAEAEDFVKNTAERYLPHQEQLALIARAQNGDKGAVDRLVRTNLLLVVGVAYRFAGRGVRLLDLIQEGTIGLIRAIEHFNPEKGFQFSTYAVSCIQRAMIRNVQYHGSTVCFASKILERKLEIERVVKEMTDELGHSPTLKEIAKRLGLRVSEVSDTFGRPRNKVVSLDFEYTGRADGNPITLGGMRADTRTPSPSSHLELKEQLQSLEARVNFTLGLVETLPISDRDREIFFLYHVIRYAHGCKPKLGSVGEQIGGITRERVRQLCGNVWGKLNQPGAISSPAIFDATMTLIARLRIRLGVDRTFVPQCLQGR